MSALALKDRPVLCFYMNDLTALLLERVGNTRHGAKAIARH